MDKNLDQIADDLFAKLRTQFPKLKLGNSKGKVTDEEQTAREFEFEYTENNKSLGTVTVTISEDDGLVAIYSNDIMEDQPTFVKKRFFNFLKELREFAKQNFMSFDTRDIAKTNLEKRDYQHLVKKQHGEGNMSESKLWGTARTSYQDIGEAKLVVKHSAPINFDNPAGRTQRIESIYIENTEGERFRYPFKHLNGARALAQHISHGGNPYDQIGQYVVGLSEELAHLRMFKGYVDRHPMIGEGMGSVRDKVAERIDSVKKEIFSLQNSNFYSSFAESFTASEKSAIPEDVINDLVDRLTIRSFKEELKSVFPFIYKFIDESQLPVKELSIEDLVSEDGDKGDDGYCDSCDRPSNKCVCDDVKEVAEFRNYENFLSKLVEDNSIFSQNEEQASEAIEKLNQLVSGPIPVGVDGTNAIESLSQIVEDDELNDVFKELADIDPEADARSILKDYITIKDEENGTDVLSKVNFGTEEEPTAPPAEEIPAEPAPAEPASQAAPAPAAPAADVPPQPAPAAESKETDDVPFDGPYKKSTGSVTDKSGAKHGSHSQARHLARQGLKKAVEKAKKAGATAETVIRIGSQEMTLGEAAARAGLQFEDVFGTSTEELIEFVKSMFDDTTGQFPKGEEGVRIACEKKFGPGSGRLAEKVMSKLHSLSEMNRMKKLAGLEEGPGGLPGVDDIANMPGAKTSSNVQWNMDDNGKKSSGTDQDGYDNVMSKFKDMTGKMDLPFGFKMDPSDIQGTVANMQKGINDKIGGIAKDAGLPSEPTAAPNMPGSPTASTSPATKRDPKDVLKKLPDQQLQTMSGDQAKKMLADLKKMAGLP